MAHAYCCKWRLRANVSKRAVVEGSWNWGEQDYRSIPPSYAQLQGRGIRSTTAATRYFRGCAVDRY